MASKVYKTIIPLMIITTISINCLATVSTALSDSSRLPKNHKSYSPEEQDATITSDDNKSNQSRSSRQYDSSSMSVHASSNLDSGAYNSNPSASVQGGSGYESQHTSSSTPSTSAASAANLINSITSGPADISSLTGALAHGALWSTQQKQQLQHPSHQYYEHILSPSYPTMQTYPYVPPIANHRQWPGGHGHNFGYPYGQGPYGAAYPNSLLHSAFNGPISSMFASGTNLLTPLMSKALDLPEIICNAIALAIGTIIVGAPFILIYLLISSHMNGSSSGPGSLGNLFGNLGAMGGGLGGNGSGGGTIALTGPNSQNQNNGRRKRQVNDNSRAKKETLKRQLSLLSNPQKLEFALKSLIESISKYDNKF